MISVGTNSFVLVTLAAHAATCGDADVTFDDVRADYGQIMAFFRTLRVAYRKTEALAPAFYDDSRARVAEWLRWTCKHPLALGRSPAKRLCAS